MEKQMIVQCPKCQHSRHVHADKIPINAEFATCPKCKVRFRFRTLFKKEEASQLLMEQPETPLAPYAPLQQIKSTVSAEKTAKSLSKNTPSTAQPTSRPTEYPERNLSKELYTEKNNSSQNENDYKISEHGENSTAKDTPLIVSHEPHAIAEHPKEHKDIWDAMDFLNESWKTSDLPQSITTKTSLPNEQAQPREPLHDAINVEKSHLTSETATPAEPIDLLRPFPTEEMPLEVKASFSKESSVPKRETTSLEHEDTLVQQKKERSARVENEALPTTDNNFDKLENFENSNNKKSLSSTFSDNSNDLKHSNSTRLRVQKRDYSLPSENIEHLQKESTPKKISFFAKLLRKEKKEKSLPNGTVVQTPSAAPIVSPAKYVLNADSLAKQEHSAAPIASSAEYELNDESYTKQEHSAAPSSTEQISVNIQPDISPLIELAEKNCEVLRKTPDETSIEKEQPVLFTQIAQSLEEKVDSDIASLVTSAKRPIRDLGLLEEFGKHAFDENVYELHEDIPWENIKNYGLVKGFMGTMHMVLFEPGFFFQKFSVKDVFLPAYFFALLQFYIAFICSFLWINTVNTFWATPEHPFITVTPYFSFQNILFLTPILVGLGLIFLTCITLGILKITSNFLPFSLVFRYLSYSFAPLTLSLIPFAGPFIALLWVLIALNTAYKTTIKKKNLSFLLAVLPLATLSVSIITLLL